MECEKAGQQLPVPSCTLAAWSLYGTRASAHKQQQAEPVDFGVHHASVTCVARSHSDVLGTE